MLSAPPAVEIRFVFEGTGGTVLAYNGELRSWPKSRLWVLADGVAVLRIPEGVYGGVGRLELGQVSRLTVRGKNAEARLLDGGNLRLAGDGCGCGMGAVASAGPIDENHKLTRINPEGWVDWA